MANAYEELFLVSLGRARTSDSGDTAAII